MSAGCEKIPEKQEPEPDTGLLLLKLRAICSAWNMVSTVQYRFLRLTYAYQDLILRQICVDMEDASETLREINATTVTDVSAILSIAHIYIDLGNKIHESRIRSLPTISMDLAKVLRQYQIAVPASEGESREF